MCRQVIERALAGTLVDGSSASCAELESLIRVDRKAVSVEKDRLENLGGGDAKQKEVIVEAEKAIENQVAKREARQKAKGCSPELKLKTDNEIYERADGMIRLW